MFIATIWVSFFVPELVLKLYLEAVWKLLVKTVVLLKCVEFLIEIL